MVSKGRKGDAAALAGDVWATGGDKGGRTLLVGIWWQTRAEKYLDNADDKRLLNVICKLEGWRKKARERHLAPLAAVVQPR